MKKPGGISKGTITMIERLTAESEQPNALGSRVAVVLWDELKEFAPPTGLRRKELLGLNCSMNQLHSQSSP